MSMTRRIACALPALILFGGCVSRETTDDERRQFPESAQPSLMPDPSAETIARWDFAQCGQGWAAEAEAGTAWACGKIRRGPASDRTGDAQGWGVGMDGPPAGRTETTLTSPPVLLDGATGEPFTLSAWQWLDADDLPGLRDSGGGAVEVLDSDRGAWVAVLPAGGYDGVVVAPGTRLHGRQGFTDRKVERVWRRSLFDLSPWAGSPIRVRFRAALGTETPGDGWFIDEVEVLRGGIVADVVDTDLKVCGAGAVVRFPFRTCDQGFGTTGTLSSWACGPATSPAEYPETPLGDGPQFDVDDTGLLFATAPSGLHNSLEVSDLVSPAMDLSGCQGRTTTLSFWHWYHFAPGSGGLIEVWDGGRWIGVAPVRGYGGPVEAARPVIGSAPPGFVTPDDRGSGWRFEVLDVSKHVNAAFRVRFRFFAGPEKRPGWYVDTVAVSTFALEDLPRLDGDPKKPGCGFAAADHKEPDLRRDPLPEPCVMGSPLVPPTTVELDTKEEPKEPDGVAVAPADGASVQEVADDAATEVKLPVAEVVEFDVPKAGVICLVIENGSADKATRVSNGTVLLDDRQIIGPDRFNAAQTLIRERAKVEAGRRKLTISATAMAASATAMAASDVPAVAAGSRAPHYTYQVYYQAGEAMPLEFGTPQGMAVGQRPAGRFMNVALTTHRNERGVQLEMEAPVPAIAVGPQTYVAPYVVQIADSLSCRQVRELRGWFPVRTATARGMEEALATTGFLWDGRGEDGKPLRANRAYVRVFAATAMAGLDVLPLPGAAPAAAKRDGGGGPLPPQPLNVTGPISQRDLNLIRTSPVLVRLIWKLTTPHVGGFCRSLACSTERVGDSLAWACAPNAVWLSVGVGEGFRQTSRALCLTGNYPRPGRYEFEFQQSQEGEVKRWWTELTWLAPPGVEVRPGYWLEVTLPVVGDGRPPFTANPWPGAASVAVRHNGAPMIGSPREFAFAHARFLGIDPPTHRPGGFTRGNLMTLRGHLLATYRVIFQMTQRGVGLATFGPPTTRDDAADLTVPNTVELGPAWMRVFVAVDNVPVLGGPYGFEVVPCHEWGNDPFLPGEGELCDPYSGIVYETYPGPWCVLGPPTVEHQCELGCHGAGERLIYPGLSEGAIERQPFAVCLCSDTDFGNPFERGSVTGVAGSEDRCEGGVLQESVAAPVGGVGCHVSWRSVSCAHGCLDGACVCPSSPEPIVFGCLPFDWPIPPAGEEAAYGRAFGAICRQQVARFAAASGLADHRCYRARPMWFPQHWHQHRDSAGREVIGSNQASENPSWPYGRLNIDLLRRWLVYWWQTRLYDARAGRCPAPMEYLCDYGDVNVLVGLAAWRWAHSAERGDARGSVLAENNSVLSGLIALLDFVPHELGHIFGYRSGAKFRMLCDEYSLCAYEKIPADHSGIACANDPPPSDGYGLGWYATDTTCRRMCGDHITLVADCLGAPLSLEAATFEHRWRYDLHCFMGHGTGGYCGYCKDHFTSAFPLWVPTW